MPLKENSPSHSLCASSPEARSVGLQAGASPGQHRVQVPATPHHAGGSDRRAVKSRGTCCGCCGVRSSPTRLSEPLPYAGSSMEHRDSRDTAAGRAAGVKAGSSIAGRAPIPSGPFLCSIEILAPAAGGGSREPTVQAQTDRNALERTNGWALYRLASLELLPISHLPQSRDGRNALGYARTQRDERGSKDGERQWKPTASYWWGTERNGRRSPDAEGSPWGDEASPPSCFELLSLSVAREIVGSSSAHVNPECRTHGPRVWVGSKRRRGVQGTPWWRSHRTAEPCSKRPSGRSHEKLERPSRRLFEPTPKPRQARKERGSKEQGKGLLRGRGAGSTPARDAAYGRNPLLAEAYIGYPPCSFEPLSEPVGIPPR